VFQRTLFACIAALALTAGRADAITVRDVIELSKAGLGDSVLLALIEVDRSVFAIDTATLKHLKETGISDTVILAMIKSGRETPPPSAAREPAASEPAASEPATFEIDPSMPDAAAASADTAPTAGVIDPAPQPIYYPVAVPVYVPFAPYGVGAVGPRRGSAATVKATVATDQGLFTAHLPVPPNCVKAEPVYWGFGGKLRPGSWEPPPTIVCR
jgi:hypothetical protein